ncbi:hypothetical protein FHW58_001057 [Duganella sp. 1224]|uniref:hypothetical protein n=1 Tax=Duganella sp. 1224 TaxID=2587052 RepID=UPI0015C891E8|nr:hypothetical protein [Duganella sp. 1224]NYE59905.1 hypothetical protein [Duganella sp. 1224]
MKVWASRRRENGYALAAAVRAVDGTSLLELVVVEVALDGDRRPSKIARLMPISEQRILVQLLQPKLVKLQGGTLVLSGIEELRQSGDRPRGLAQTWVCQSRMPGGRLPH